MKTMEQQTAASLHLHTVAQQLRLLVARMESQLKLARVHAERGNLEELAHENRLAAEHALSALQTAANETRAGLDEALEILEDFQNHRANNIGEWEVR